MRRILSILLFALLLFNMVGYSVVYLTEQRNSISNAHASLIQRASNSADLVIKIPVAVPYQTNWDAPEAAEGQIEHNGHFYQMKSRQLLNDTMYVHCKYDQNARDRFSNLVSKINDEVTGQSSDQQNGQHSTLIKNFLKEYMDHGQKHVFFVLEWTPAHTVIPTTVSFTYPETHFSIPSPPPIQA